jgi:hypothetical protein
VPDDVRDRFKLDTTFYGKHVDAGGIPVIAAPKVPDEALLVARDIINHMLAGRADIRADIIKRGGRVGVIANSDSLLDLPEHRDWKRPGSTGTSGRAAWAARSQPAPRKTYSAIQARRILVSTSSCTSSRTTFTHRCAALIRNWTRNYRSRTRKQRRRDVPECTR